MANASMNLINAVDGRWIVARCIGYTFFFDAMPFGNDNMAVSYTLEGLDPSLHCPRAPLGNALLPPTASTSTQASTNSPKNRTRKQETDPFL